MPSSKPSSALRTTQTSATTEEMEQIEWLREILVEINTLVQVGAAAWGHFGSPWVGVAGFLLVIVPSVPIYGLLHGDTEPPA